MDWLSGFRGSKLWHLLKRFSFLRSGYYLAIEFGESFKEPQVSSLEMTDADFKKSVDPWKYETDALEQERFALQTAALDDVRGTQRFVSGLEIGCAEGLFTEVLAERCDSLLVLDLSPTALERTRNRRSWPEGVHFEAFDLRGDSLPGHFDLIVVAGVLEYFTKHRTFIEVREKLTAALRPNGYLLVETTRKSPVVEEAWWARVLIRGKGINSFMAREPRLHTVSQVLTNRFAITLLRKIPSAE